MKSGKYPYTFANKDDLAERYLQLLERVLVRSLPRSYESLGPRVADRGKATRLGYAAIKRVLGPDRELAQKVNLNLREDGRDGPQTSGETMIGIKRLDNLRLLIKSVISAGVPGDLIEAGVWRGGAVIFMRAALETYGDRERMVWAADSFRGLPDSGGFDDARLHSGEMSVSLNEVKANFEWYGWLDDRIHFLPGWFKDTLPSAPMENLALIRLDGDLYESTYECLKYLYPRLSKGGYIVIDDYNCYPGAKQATEDFRNEQSIVDKLVKIDWAGVYWQRSSDNAKGKRRET